MDDDNESDDYDVSWQVVQPAKLQKRRLTEYPKIFKPKRRNSNKVITSTNYNNTNKKINNNITDNCNETNPSKQAVMFKNITTTDKYASQNMMKIMMLLKNIKMIKMMNENINLPKPPQIIIPNVANISAMTRNFSREIKVSEFKYKTLSNGQIRVIISIIQSYRILV